MNKMKLYLLVLISVAAIVMLVFVPPLYAKKKDPCDKPGKGNKKKCDEQTAEISIQELQGLNFGNILADPNKSTVTVSPTGSYSATGLTIVRGFPQEGTFKIYGEPNYSVFVEFYNNERIEGPGKRMKIKNFKTLPSNSFSFGYSGNFTVRVGADLEISKDQTGGRYEGQYAIIVSYE